MPGRLLKSLSKTLLAVRIAGASGNSTDTGGGPDNDASPRSGAAESNPSSSADRSEGALSSMGDSSTTQQYHSTAQLIQTPSRKVIAACQNAVQEGGKFQQPTPRAANGSGDESKGQQKSARTATERPTTPSSAQPPKATASANAATSSNKKPTGIAEESILKELLDQLEDLASVEDEVERTLLQEYEDALERYARHQTSTTHRGQRSGSKGPNLFRNLSAGLHASTPEFSEEPPSAFQPRDKLAAAQRLHRIREYRRKLKAEREKEIDIWIKLQDMEEFEAELDILLQAQTELDLQAGRKNKTTTRYVPSGQLTPQQRLKRLEEFQANEKLLAEEILARIDSDNARRNMQAAALVKGQQCGAASSGRPYGFRMIRRLPASVDNFDSLERRENGRHVAAEAIMDMGLR